MSRTVRVLVCAGWISGLLFPQEPTTASGWLDLGKQLRKERKTLDAFSAFDKAVTLDPENLEARRLLGQTAAGMWKADRSAESAGRFEVAEAQFRFLIERNPKDFDAWMSLGQIYNTRGTQILAPGGQDANPADLREARRAFEKANEIDPKRKEPYVLIGQVSMALASVPMMQAGQELRGASKLQGPLPDSALRFRLRTSVGADLEKAIASFEKASTIDPDYAPAHVMLFLAHKTKAMLQDTQAEFDKEMEVAKAAAEKASTAASKATPGAVMDGIIASVPPAPAIHSPEPATGAQRIRVGGNIQSTNLIEKVMPVYPPEAKEARIQGLVRFTAIIGTSGNIVNLQLVSGHPLLVPSAQDAVKQWRYKPTLLNGNPVEVITAIDVNYTLEQ
jgi:TonB family protein